MIKLIVLSIEVDESTRQILQNLRKKYALAIVSVVYSIEDSWRVFWGRDLEKLFSSVIFATEERAKDEDLYAITLSRLGVKRDEAIIVTDDNLNRAVPWGNRNGVETVWLKNGSKGEGKGVPTLVISDFSEFSKIF